MAKRRLRFAPNFWAIGGACETSMALTQGRRCTPTGGVETAVAVGAPSRADGNFGAWLRPWRTILNRFVTGLTVLV